MSRNRDVVFMVFFWIRSMTCLYLTKQINNCEKDTEDGSRDPKPSGEAW